MKIWKIYLATCLVNNKVYVGQTCASLAARKRSHKYGGSHNTHGQVFHTAIAKYGYDSFDWQILAEVYSKEAADNLEKLWIAILNSRDRKYGYNLTTGGEGSTGINKTEECKKKISIANKGFKHSLDTCKQISNTMKGIKHSPAAVALMRKAAFVRVYPDDWAQKCKEVWIKRKEKARAEKDGVLLRP